MAPANFLGNKTFAYRFFKENWRSIDTVGHVFKGSYTFLNGSNGDEVTEHCRKLMS